MTSFYLSSTYLEQVGEKKEIRTVALEGTRTSKIILGKIFLYKEQMYYKTFH